VARGMTQQRLAERAEVGHSLVAALESGRRRYVSAEDVEQLARGLDIPAEDLWEADPWREIQPALHIDSRLDERGAGAAIGARLLPCI